MLTGLHRLWLFIAILYLSIIIALNWSSFPTKNDIYRGWYIELTYLLNEKIDEDQSDYNQLILGLENKIQQLRKVYWGTYDAMLEIRARHKAKLMTLKKEQIHLIKKWFWIWILPLMCIYILGWSIVWVLKGFVKQ